MLRANVTPIRCWLRTEYLYNMDPAHKGEVKASIIGVASYPGDALTFDMLIESTGGTYHYIPPPALSTIQGSPVLPLELTVYHDCPNGRIAVSKLDALSKIDKCYAWLDGKFHAAFYHFTVDWYKDNLLLHILSLETGQIIAWPNHKILFTHKKPEKLPDYLKLRQKWQVGKLK